MRNFKWIMAVYAVMTFVGCAMPPSPIANSSQMSGGSSSPSDTTSVNGASASGSRSPASTTTTTTPNPVQTVSPTTPVKPTCTIATPQIKSYYGGYYMELTMTLTSTVQISYVSYTLTDSYSMYTQQIGMASTAPYQIQYPVNSYGYGAQVVTASAVDVNGQQYASICNAAYQIRWP